MTAPRRHRGLGCALLAPGDGSSLPKLLMSAVLLPGAATGWDLVVFVLPGSSQVCWSRVVIGFPTLALPPRAEEGQDVTHRYQRR